MGWDFRVLGPVAVTVDGQPARVGGTKLLVLLSGLLLRANRPVPVEQLTRWVWDGEEPTGARNAIQTYVLRLRRLLGPDVVRTVPGGYQITASEDSLDLTAFDLLLERARRAETGGELPVAASLLTKALALWRGPAFADVESDALRRNEFRALDERHTRTREHWADVLLRLGRHDEVLGVLNELTREEPMRERSSELLMLALYRAGRQADALAEYRRIAGMLADELGVDPSRGLRQTHQRILTADPTLAPSAGERPVVAREVPRQLPGDATGFTGREADLEQLGATLAEDAGEDNVAIAVIEGTAGVGKTALAVHFAHRVVERFPDGQVYLDLRGYGPGEPMDASAALASALQSVGVPGDALPSDVDARSAMWRTRTAGRRMLIVLDNARSSQDVRPLLPGAGCMVLASTRAQMIGLGARDGARRITLHALSMPEAIGLLEKLVGAQRVQADPVASARFVDRCDRLPLAIRILGERAASEPDVGLAEFLDEMAELDGTLAPFTLDDDKDTDLTAVFTYSYDALDPDAARLFRLLGLHPGTEFGAELAAACSGLSTSDARRTLDRLCGAHLVERRDRNRYQLHDLMREFAGELTRHHDGAADIAAAGDRIFLWYLHSLRNANLHLNRHRFAERVPPVPDGLVPLTFTGYRAALEWCDREHANLLAVARRATTLSPDSPLWTLCWSMMTYFLVRSRFDDWEATTELAIDVCRAREDLFGEARMLSGVAVKHFQTLRFADAIACSERALAICREIDVPSVLVNVLSMLAISHAELGHQELALDYGRRALEAAPSTPGAKHTWLALRSLAMVNTRFGRYAEALEYCGLALEAAGEIGLADCEALVLRESGRAHRGLGRLDESARMYLRAIDVHGELEMQLEVALSVLELGEVRLRQGRPVEARLCWTKALHLFEQAGHPDAELVRAKLSDTAVAAS
ncbi:DNA-binding SARP family transcriptional activator [Herbihabitans rhizosphaerae]|uniref:DNA-binding SARP family transcriptional activator n=1 Tax=Herbihabitans rhizosphaerae TaxID=1872711 RepID=A0A4Q7KWU9_9PSEU|nr:AfsR/SARP family transcriptional regulator [Herbihabitans rhizosphaerae]RZS41076.1 DNA-binding SARP family transcriptional activator [Herbihabitans rhizosphaerae]